LSGVDTPDYQRGVVSAQVLLAAVPAGPDSVIVGIPPNAETLVIATIAPFEGSSAGVLGQTTGLEYPGQSLAAPPGSFAGVTYYFDVSAALDAEVEIFFIQPTPGPWWVYSDAGAHVVIDGSKYTNNQGIQYVIPTVPSTASAQNPPTEVQYFSAELTAAGAFIAAPAAGQRLRVFTLNMATPTAGLSGYLNDPTAGGALCVHAGPGSVAVSLPAQGVPITEATALDYAIAAGAGAMLLAATYTVETA
jgi:hypothetical protein